MRTFTFDARVAKEPAAVAARTRAGRNAPAGTAPPSTKPAGPGFNPFGFLGSTTLSKPTSTSLDKENQASCSEIILHIKGSYVFASNREDVYSQII